MILNAIIETAKADWQFIYIPYNDLISHTVSESFPVHFNTSYFCTLCELCCEMESCE